jgi:hypothetical protein
VGQNPHEKAVFLPPRPAIRQVFAFNASLWGQAVNLKKRPSIINSNVLV